MTIPTYALRAAACALALLVTRRAAAASTDSPTDSTTARRAAPDSAAARAARTASGTEEPELVTDRPDYTESAQTVPWRSVQVEAGATLDRTGGALTGSAGEVLLRIGVRPRAELRVELNSYVADVRPAGGASIRPQREDASVGAKFLLHAPREERRAIPGVALIVGTSVPTGSAAVRHSALEPEAKLLLGWSVAPGWDVSSNLNVSSARCEDDACAAPGAPPRRRVTEGAASLSLGHELGARLGAYAELYGGRPSVGTGWQYANAGLTLGLAPTLQLDARVGTGFGATRGDYFVGAGLARRF